jgi:hypothetical protein
VCLAKIIPQPLPALFSRSGPGEGRSSYACPAALQCAPTKNQVNRPARFTMRSLACSPGVGFLTFKDFRLAESKTLQFRAEIFNILNRPNFGIPVNDINSPNFGQIQSAAAPRLIQLALKFMFEPRKYGAYLGRRKQEATLLKFKAGGKLLWTTHCARPADTMGC